MDVIRGYFEKLTLSPKINMPEYQNDTNTKGCIKSYQICDIEFIQMFTNLIAND